MTIKSAEPEMTPEAETIIKAYANQTATYNCILLDFRYYSMSRRVTENSDRHITVRQLESTVRLAQGSAETRRSLFPSNSLAHAKLIFSKQVTILDATVAVLLMEASLNGCGKLLDKMNALHTTFAPQPEAEYAGHGTANLHSIISANRCFSFQFTLFSIGSIYQNYAIWN